MSGSIIQLEEGRKSRCRKWRVQAYAGRNPQTGKYRRVTKVVNGTYTDAERVLAAITDDIRENRSVEVTSIELRDFAETWLERQRANAVLAPRTIEKHAGNINALNMVLGRARIQDLTPWDIEDAYAKMRSGVSPSGNPLSGAYVAGCHVTLNLIMKEAVRRRMVKHNPCVDAQAPRVDTPEKTALNSADLLVLISRLDVTNRNHVAVLLCCMLGLRRGEVVALDWSDIDFAERTVTIRRSYDDLGNLKSPKTKASTRTIPLPEAVVDALIALHGESCRYDALFCDEFGNRMKPHSLSTWWRRNRSGLGFPDITLHELRHSFVTHLARSGVPVKTAQVIVGHSRPSITLDVYSHADLDDKRRAISQAF